jgi:hypothetical protein
MACTITSLILVAMFGVMAVGLVGRASLKGGPPARQNGSPAIPELSRCVVGPTPHLGEVGGRSINGGRLPAF